MRRKVFEIHYRAKNMSTSEHHTHTCLLSISFQNHGH
uniref:Uncharacterized protein n=1 Tax=Anguilla anguilla TaxID=7936 RepID=A0A0E9RSQ7_ANGAN